MEILVFSPRSKSGGPKCPSRTGREDGWGKKPKKSFLRVKFCRTKMPFFGFLPFLKIDDFDRQISPLKQRLQKKWSTPQRRQRKIQEICHLRFWIFKLLSQRFFNSKYDIFHFFENLKICKF